MPKNKVLLDRNLASALQNQHRKTMRDIEYRYSDLVRMKVISRINTFLQMASYSGSNKKKYICKKDCPINEWGQNAMSYLCNMDTDSMPEKYQFVKFCDKMVRTNEYYQFLVLAVDKPINFKYKILKYEKDFFYSPTYSKIW